MVMIKFFRFGSHFVVKLLRGWGDIIFPSAISLKSPNPYFYWSKW
ncbi:hypothetical protein HPHPP16_0598 [Helicobacter pylori Hp P-16]|nr:hypothetical protein HPHPP16_0598 [Helicobacter pylori Hp P-16]